MLYRTPLRKPEPPPYPEDFCKGCGPGVELLQRDGVDVFVHWCGRCGIEKPMDEAEGRAAWEAGHEWARVDRRPCPYCGLVSKYASSREHHMETCPRRADASA